MLNQRVVTWNLRSILNFFIRLLRAGSRPMHRSEKKLPMHSLVRFLPQIMKNNTFCENTCLKMHQFPQSYFFLEMSTKHCPKFVLKFCFSPKHALALLRWHSRLWYIPRCFKIYYSIISKMSIIFIFWKIVELIFDFVYVYWSARIKCVYAIWRTILYLWNITNYAHKSICQCMFRENWLRQIKICGHSFSIHLAWLLKHRHVSVSST